MKLIYCLCIALLFSSSSSAQVVEATPIDYGNTKDTIGIFKKVEVEASFPGGADAWRRFLYTNLKADAPVKEVPRKIKYFEQTVLVRFIVCKDGSICNVQAVNNVLPSIKKEAERVINKSGNWVPAQQDGKPVKSYYTQPITFIVDSK